MKPQVREPFRIRHLIASIFAVGFLVGAVVALAFFVKRNGVGFSAGFGFVVAAAVAWLLIRAMSGSPYRQTTVRMLLRSVAFLLITLGPVILMFLAYAPIFVHARKISDARALLVVAALLFILTFACATVGGRRMPKDGRKRQQGQRH